MTGRPRLRCCDFGEDCPSTPSCQGKVKEQCFLLNDTTYRDLWIQAKDKISTATPLQPFVTCSSVRSNVHVSVHLHLDRQYSNNRHLAAGFLRSWETLSSHCATKILAC